MKMPDSSFRLLPSTVALLCLNAVITLVPRVWAFQPLLSVSYYHDGRRTRTYTRSSRRIDNVDDASFSFVTTRLQSSLAVLDTTEQASRDIATMEEWAAGCGVQRAESFQLTWTNNFNNEGDDAYDYYNDICAMTTDDIPANSPVLMVPNFMIISSQQAMNEFGRLDAAEKMLKSLNAMDQMHYFYIMIKILVEYEQGEQSSWYAWLNSLPRYFSNGASMTSFCYTCLPPLVASLAMQERVNLDTFQSIVEVVPFLSESTKKNTQLIKWAFQIAYTRSIPIFEDIVVDDDDEKEDTSTESSPAIADLRIVPMVDMFNHGAEAEIDIQYDDEGNCWAQTIRDVPAGSPLRTCYADPTNPSYLFARYGFVDESSPATFCKIIVPHQTKDLVALGCAPNRMLFYKESGEVSEEVWDILLYQILSSSNAATKRTFMKAHQMGDYETKSSIHEQYYPQTSEKLLTHIDTFLQGLDKLSIKMQDKDVHEHPRLPLIWKHNQFVKNTFLAVRERFFG